LKKLKICDIFDFILVDFFQAQAAQNSASSPHYSDAVPQAQTAQNSTSSEHYSDAVLKRFI
jgi:hypothetical protein